MPDTQHVDVYFSIGGKDYFAGHGDIEKGSNESVSSQVASMLHQLAWAFEEMGSSPVDAGVEDNGENRSTPQPRKVITPLGNMLFEVAPGEFAPGDSFERAVELYGRGYVIGENYIRRAFPGSLWQYMD